MLARICAFLWVILLASWTLAQDVPKFELQPVVQQLRHPVYVWHDGISDRLYIVEQRGTIRLVEDGKLLPTPYLDIVQQVESGGECGLLSVAFSPKFAENGLLYVNYTQKKGRLRTIVSEFRTTPEARQVDPSTERVILSIDQPFANHNGGHILFGPDGMLYIGMGDGGAANDPHNHAQNPRSLLGKILRIDVSSGDPYTIPRDNPFLSDRRFAREIWALGLRNPWRMCFDPESGLMITGDVGQNMYEEVAVVSAGQNHGWRAREGFHPNPTLRMREEPISVDTDPIVEYEHRTYLHAGYRRQALDNCIGGFVYRGRAIPALAGWYLYADYNSGRIWGLRHRRGRLVANQLLMETTINISSFGEDRAGEIYICDHQKGAILKLVPR